MNNEQYKPADRAELIAVLEGALVDEVIGHHSAEWVGRARNAISALQATPSAGTIDTDELRELLAALTEAASGDADEYGEARKALLAYIMDWHSAGVAAARQEGYTLGKGNADAWLAVAEGMKLRAEKAETALAAAREQALEEVRSMVVDLGYMDGDDERFLEGCNHGVAKYRKGIAALASTKAEALPTDEVSVELSVDRDAPLRGAPAVSDLLHVAVWEALNVAESSLDYRPEFRRALSKLHSAWAAAAPVAQDKPVVQPELAVWYGAMPESNGASNFTATLMRKGADFFDTDQYTFSRSEYPDRVRYEADFMRYLIGERAERPEMWDKCYDFDKHSGYVKPAELVAATQAERQEQVAGKAVREVIRAINSDSGEGWSEQDEDVYWTQLLYAIQKDQQGERSDG